jgi:hypothetical protein
MVQCPLVVVQLMDQYLVATFIVRMMVLLSWYVNNNNYSSVDFTKIGSIAVDDYEVFQILNNY